MSERNLDCPLLHRYRGERQKIRREDVMCRDCWSRVPDRLQLAYSRAIWKGSKDHVVEIGRRCLDLVRANA